MLSPRALVRGIPARAKFAAENSITSLQLLVTKYKSYDVNSAYLFLTIHVSLYMWTFNVCLEWGLLNQFPSFPYFPNFSSLSKHTLTVNYCVYVWQASCGDTCQIWMWFEEYKMHLCKIEHFSHGEINERGFSNPTRGVRQLHVHVALRILNAVIHLKISLSYSWAPFLLTWFNFNLSMNK